MNGDWKHYEVRVLLLALCDAGQHIWCIGTAQFPCHPPHLPREATQL